MSETLAHIETDSRIHDKALAERMAYAEKPHRDAAIQALSDLEKGLENEYHSPVDPADTFAEWQELQAQEQPESITETEVEEKAFSYRALVRGIGRGIVKIPANAGRKAISAHDAHHRRKAEQFISERIAEETAYQNSNAEVLSIIEDSKQAVEAMNATSPEEPDKPEQKSRYRRPHSKTQKPKQQQLTKDQVEELAESHAQQIIANRDMQREAERAEQERRNIAARIIHGDKGAAKDSIDSFGMFESRRLIKQIIARQEVEGGKKLTQIEKDKLRKSLIAEIELHNKNADRLKKGAAPLFGFKKGEVDHNALAAQAVEHNRRHRALKSKAFH